MILLDCPGSCEMVSIWLTIQPDPLCDDFVALAQTHREVITGTDIPQCPQTLQVYTVP